MSKQTSIKQTGSLSENQRIIDSYDYLANAASASDCTGLIPSAPASDAELASYEAIYHYQPPAVPKRELPNAGHKKDRPADPI